MISGALDGDWYYVHAMNRLGSFREENEEKRICRCASSRSGSGVEVIAPKSEAFRTSLAELPAVDASADCRWRREERGVMTGLEFEALQLKITVK